ncbi:MAG: hypothetical protein QM751_05160 [Paludibacteraceae bacterium]
MEKTKREAREKINLIIRNKGCDVEYLEDLKTVIEYEAISGYALRLINRLKTSAYSTLPDLISSEYIQKILHSFDNVK